MTSLKIKNIYTPHNQLPLVSDHVRPHSPLTDDEFGHFLAGLIEGGGWFGYLTLIIVFSIEDTSLAFFIKKRIGYGNVYKIKDKNAVRYICRHSAGLLVILNLINGKFIS